MKNSCLFQIPLFPVKQIIDFLYFSLIDFPIFNVADIYVTCSAILLFILILFVYKDEDLGFLSGKKEKKQ